MNKTFTGFGFGAIQSGLFLYEAYRSANFTRFVVCEVDRELVQAVRDNNGRYTVNIARREGIDQFELQGIEIYDPTDEADHDAIIDAVAQSDEISTALPSVDFYDRGQSSPASLIGQGLARRKAAFPTIIYASENHNHAAEMLSNSILNSASNNCMHEVETLNTVIGKMSGVITDQETISRMRLAPLTPTLERAVLVEEFNRILISKVQQKEYIRGIEVFIEKEDLLPFEEAKLYGHNAIHALIAYLAAHRRYPTIAHAGKDAWIMKAARDAFIEESGAALIARHHSLGEFLFTPEGYREYADDLLARMINPNLNDLVSRVGRDTHRKLGYNDRIFGTMRLALQAGITPNKLALGAAAGVLFLLENEPPEQLDKQRLGDMLCSLWGDQADKDTDMLIELTSNGLTVLAAMQ
jgi:mannitol-1-phosphate 5-dehydrogenase